MMNKGILMVAAAAAVMVMAVVGEAQIDAGCAQQLSPCLDFVESANPPVSCCGPIQDVVINDLSCLCFLYTNSDFLQTYGLNRTIAVGLVRRCGITVSFASCHASAAAPPTQATLARATPGAEAGGVGRVSRTTGLAFVLLFGAALVLH
ncbi:hypothetical protein QN277_028179 [Acacia crassicarpa]|nr:hypothetical protein QN277_028179 [Acacia crassicarpa]